MQRFENMSVRLRGNRHCHSSQCWWEDMAQMAYTQDYLPQHRKAKDWKAKRPLTGY